jgi:DNA-3-methyladenine glycosylase II
MFSMADQANTYLVHLSRDRKMKKILGMHFYLCASIMSQQLSTRVARVIRQRFLELYGSKVPSPAMVLKTPVETLRSVGLSWAKASYIHNVSRFALERGMNLRDFSKKTDEEAISYLMQIKGVGRWTAEMLLIFTLGRPDIFALGDLGIQQAMKKLYRLDNSDQKRFKQDMASISEKWRPYRSYACLHLWKWKDKAK